VLMFVGKVCGKTEEAVNFYTSVFKNSPSGAKLRRPRKRISWRVTTTFGENFPQIRGPSSAAGSRINTAFRGRSLPQ